MEEIFKSITTQANSLVDIWPVGMISPFSGDKNEIDKLKQDGWFLCNGNALSKIQYPALFEVIGTTCGGRGIDFDLPDLRGIFLRGVDVANDEQGTPRDPDRNSRLAHVGYGTVGNQVLSRQDNEIREHKHVTTNGLVLIETEGLALAAQGSPFSAEINRFTAPKPTAPIVTNQAGGTESRGANVSVNYIIYAGRAATPAAKGDC